MIDTKIRWPHLVVVVLAGCGENSITSGFGIDVPVPVVCGDVQGEYRGTAVSDSGGRSWRISLSLRQQACELKGGVVLLPCVPATGIRGAASGLGAFEIETLSDSPFLALNSEPNIDLDSPGAPNTVRYTLTTDGSGGCPMMDSGTVMLSRAGGS